MCSKSEIPLCRKQHIRYFKRFLCMLPECLDAFDSTRLTLAFFSLAGLDLLDGLNDLEESFKQNICEWIYRQQILPTKDGDVSKCGFQGSDTLNVCIDGVRESCNPHFAMGHIAMTYTGLASLIILGDDLSRVNRTAVATALRSLQQPDGSFCAMVSGSENDVRFVYCAACICYILHDWSGIDVPLTVAYIRKCMSYDYGFGQNPGEESHGGVTYCALAALSLMDQLESTFSLQELERIQRWLVMRQETGFQGRPNKPVDTCYSFWVGASIKITGLFDLIEKSANRGYIMVTQDTISGGFSKWINVTPDPMHTYLGLGALSLMNEEGLQEIDPSLNMTKRAVVYLHKLQANWQQ